MAQPTPSPRPATRPWLIEFGSPNGRGLAACTSFLLGLAAGASLLVPLLCPSASPFAVYFFLLILFHESEYLLTAAFRPDTLSWCADRPARR